MIHDELHGCVEGEEKTGTKRERKIEQFFYTRAYTQKCQIAFCVDEHYPFTKPTYLA